MTRVFTDGAEFQDFLFWDAKPTYAEISTSVKRSGAASYKNDSTDVFYKSFTALSEAFIRFGLYDTTTGFASKYFYLYTSTTTLIAELRRNAGTNFLEAYVNGSLVATGSIAIAINTWYLVEVHYKLADAGDFEVKVDGILDIDYSGDTKPGSDTTFNRFGLSKAINNYAYFDDIAMNNTADGVDDSWCGDGRVILLKPNANGDSSGLTGSDADSIDNYLLVDDIPSDADTTYVESSGSGVYDLYNLTASGLSDVAILRVWPEARARDLVAEGAEIILVTKTEGAEHDSSSRSLLTSYTRVVGDEYRKNPETDSDWTIEELDAVQVGPKVV